MKKTLTLLIITLTATLTLPAMAGHNSPELSRLDRVEQRLANQRLRIHERIRNGQITRKEAKRLHHQQRYILRLTHRFMHDGYLDRFEFRELKNELNRASNRIFNIKHNDRYRASNRYYY